MFGAQGDLDLHKLMNCEWGAASKERYKTVTGPTSHAGPQSALGLLSSPTANKTNDFLLTKCVLGFKTIVIRKPISILGGNSISDRLIHQTRANAAPNCPVKMCTQQYPEL